MTPIQPMVVRVRVRTQLDARRVNEPLRDQNTWLEADGQRRIDEVDLTEGAGIPALALPAETRDTDEGVQVARIQRFVEEVALRLRDHPRFAAFSPMARTIARSHRATFDRSGCRDGLADEAIPVPARLMAVEAVFDALI